jgi:hypothetical protein
MRTAVLALAAACLLPLPAAALSLDDARAMRALQSRLMVAALKCDAPELYNPVVERHRPLLAQAERVLRARHGRRHDRWTTEMANQDSRRANGLGDGACDDARPLAEALLAAPSEGPVLAALARAHQVSWPRP